MVRDENEFTSYEHVNKYAVLLIAVGETSSFSVTLTIKFDKKTMELAKFVSINSS